MDPDGKVQKDLNGTVRNVRVLVEGSKQKDLLKTSIREKAIVVVPLSQILFLVHWFWCACVCHFKINVIKSIFLMSV